MSVAGGGVGGGVGEEPVGARRRHVGPAGAAQLRAVERVGADQRDRTPVGEESYRLTGGCPPR